MPVVSNFQSGSILYAANLNTTFANTVNVTGDAMLGTLTAPNMTANVKVVTGTVIANTAISISGIDIASGLSQAQANANSALNLSQAAFNTANASSGGFATAAFTKANSANVLAQAAFGQANTSTTLAQAAFNQANTSSGGGGSGNSLTQTFITANGITVNGATSLTVVGNNILTISSNIGTTTQQGVIQLTDTITSQSTTTAATPNSVNTVWATALAAMQKVNSVGGILTNFVAANLSTNGISSITISGNTQVIIAGNNATTLTPGLVILNDTITSTSTTLAATANSVNAAYMAAISAGKINVSMNIISGSTVTANIPFIVTGNWNLNPVLQYADDANNLASFPPSIQNINPIIATTWRFQHPSLTAGSHNLKVIDVISNTSITQTLTVVGGGNTTVNISGATLTTNTSREFSPTNATIGMIIPQSNGGGLIGSTLVLTSQSLPGAFQLVGTSLEFLAANVVPGLYSANIQISATNALNSPQTYPVFVTVFAFVPAGTSRANSLISMIGVRGDVGGGNALYTANSANVVKDINFVGAKNYRDSLASTGTPTQLGVLQAIANNGTKFIMFPPNNGNLTPFTYVINTLIANAATVAAMSANCLLALEGPTNTFSFPISYKSNTGGGPSGSYFAVADFCRDWMTAINANNTLSSAQILAPTDVGEENENVGLQFATIPSGSAVTLFPSGTSFYETENIRFNPQVNQNTELSFSSTLGDVFDLQLDFDYVLTGRNSWSGNTLSLVAAYPRYIAEYGFQTGAAPAVTDPTRGKLYLNTILNAFIDAYSGVTFNQLYNEGAGIGLMSAPGVPTTSGTYLHNFTTILSDTAANATNFPVTTLGYSALGLPTTGQSLVFQKSNGHYQIILWRNEHNYNLPANASIAVTPANVFISLSSNSFISPLISVYDPTVGITPTITIANSSNVTISVSDYPIIVDVSPTTGLTESPSGTVIVAANAAGTQIVDSAHNIWKLTGAQISLNGTTLANTANVVEEVYFQHTFYQENNLSNWWFWNGQTFIQTTNPLQLPESAQGTFIAANNFATTSIIDSVGNQWTLTNNPTPTPLQIAFNGVIDAATVSAGQTSSQVTLLLYWNHVVYQQATGSGLWWFYGSSSNPPQWLQTTDPRIVVQPPGTGEMITVGALSTAGNQIIDQFGNPQRICSATWQGAHMANSGPDMLTVNYQSLLQNIKSAGFNCIKILTNDFSWLANPNIASFINTTINTDLAANTTYVGVIQRLVTYAYSIGLRSIIESHTNEGGHGSADNFGSFQLNGLWYDTGGASNGTDGGGNLGRISNTLFHQIWVSRATTFTGNTGVIGYDVKNQPILGGTPGTTWGTYQGATINSNRDLRGMYGNVANAILAVDNTKLIFCQGPQNIAGGAPEGDLRGANTQPIIATSPQQIVYAVKEFANTINGFSGADTGSGYIARLNNVWGWMVSTNTHPCFIAESSATTMRDTDSVSNMQTLVTYLNGSGTGGGFTLSGTQQGPGWSWNALEPLSTGFGFINNDSQTIDPVSQGFYTRMTFNVPPSRLLGTTSTTSGTFTIANGQVLLNGVPFKTKGVGMTDQAMVSASTLISIFPGLNIVQFALGSDFANGATGRGYLDAIPNNQIFSWVDDATARGLIVILSDYVAGQPQARTGGDLTSSCNWYAALAQNYVNNPRVWWTTENEVTTSPDTSWVQIYNAIRNTGNKGLLFLEFEFGNINSTFGSSSSTVANMTGVGINVHSYEVSGASTTAQAFSTKQGWISNIQNGFGPSLDGKLPVFMGEGGPSSSGSAIADPFVNGNYIGVQATDQLTTNGPGGFCGYAMWVISFNGGGYTGGDAIFNPNTLANPSLTTYGQQVVNQIAASPPG